LLADEFFPGADDEPIRNVDGPSKGASTAFTEWVAEEPKSRAIRLAHHIRYARENDKGVLQWTGLATYLINLPEVGVDVAKIFYSRFDYGSGSGPWSNRFVRRRALLEDLTGRAEPHVRDWANNAMVELDTRVARMLEQERRRDERFE
jgi:hypothetical protein